MHDMQHARGPSAGGPAPASPASAIAIDYSTGEICAGIASIGGGAITWKRMSVDGHTHAYNSVIGTDSDIDTRIVQL